MKQNAFTFLGKVEEQVFERKWRKTSTEARGGLSPFKLYEYQNIELDNTFHV